VNVGKEWTIRDIATEASTSVGYTHAVVATLTNMGYVIRNEKNKLVLSNPATLLRRWAAFHQYDQINSFMEYYTFEQQVDAFLDELRGRLKNEEYALTSLAGAWIVSPHVRPIDVHFYVENQEKGKEISQLLGIKPTVGVGNVRMVIPYDKGVYYGLRMIRGIKVVSNVQLYVDLANYPARGEDAAQQLYDVIEKEWSKVLTGGADVR
jgi:hypothetical protein